MKREWNNRPRRWGAKDEGLKNVEIQIQVTSLEQVAVNTLNGGKDRRDSIGT